MHSRVVDLVNLDGHDLLQLLHLLLHLHGLRGLVAETFDEVLHLLNLLLLVLVGAQLLLTALLAQHDILVVLHLIVDDATAGDLERAVRHVVDERTVVAHQHNGRRGLRQPLFEPLYGLDVQMVRGLVEQQHVRTHEQDLGQFDTHTPAARELARRTLQVRALEAQSRERALQLSLAALDAHHQQPLVLRRVALHQRHVVLALVVRTLSHFLFQTLHARLQFADVGKGFLCLLAHGGRVL